MFAGHLSVALLAKKVEPRLPLSALVAATFCLDLIWPILLLTGLESVKVDPGNTAFTALDFAHYPWSHSLLTSLGWGAMAGILEALKFGGRRAFWIVSLVVVSHWMLDFLISAEAKLNAQAEANNTLSETAREQKNHLETLQEVLAPYAESLEKLPSELTASMSGGQLHETGRMLDTVIESMESTS